MPHSIRTKMVRRKYFERAAHAWAAAAAPDCIRPWWCHSLNISLISLSCCCCCWCCRRDGVGYPSFLSNKSWRRFGVCVAQPSCAAHTKLVVRTNQISKTRLLRLLVAVVVVKMATTIHCNTLTDCCTRTTALSTVFLSHSIFLSLGIVFLNKYLSLYYIRRYRYSICLSGLLNLLVTFSLI